MYLSELKSELLIVIFNLPYFNFFSYLESVQFDSQKKDQLQKPVI